MAGGRTPFEQMMDRALTAEHNLLEAQAELNRHHRDFDLIRQELDKRDTNNHGDWRDITGMRATLRRVRKIVG